MLAPAGQQQLVVACFSSRVMGSAGRGSSAEAPPEIRQSTRSSFPAVSAMAAMRSAPPRRAASGTGMAALVQLDALQLGEVAVLDVDQAAGDAAPEDFFGRLGHGSSGLAGADDVNIVEPRGIAALEVARDGASRVGRLQRGLKHGKCLFAKTLSAHGGLAH